MIQFPNNETKPKIMNEEDKIIFTFPVLWNEWEYDGTAWVMEKPDGTRYLKMSNHDGVYVADQEQLIERLVYYESVAIKTKTALAYLQGL
jgi:hypothetical protein